MIIADVLARLVLGLAIATGLIGWWILSAALWKERVERCTERLEVGPLWKYFLIGLLPSALIVGLLIAGAAAGPAGLLPAILATAMLMFAQVGVAGIALHIGQRFYGDAPESTQVWKGSLILAAAIALPFVGWIALFFFFTITGFGLWLAAFWKPREYLEEEPPPPLPASESDS